MSDKENVEIEQKLTIHINSPKGTVFEGEGDFLIAPGKEGILGIYPDHTKIVALLKKGDIIVKNRGEEKTIPVEEGIIQVNTKDIEILITG